MANALQLIGGSVLKGLESHTKERKVIRTTNIARKESNMADKVQKIKEWISKTQDGLMDAKGNFEYPEHEGAYHILCNLDAYIDSMQEETVAPKLLKDMLNAKTAAESLGISQEEHDRIVDECLYGKEPELVDFDNLPKEEPVSEINFEQELYKAFGQVKDFTLCLKIARRFYEIGRNYQEPVSDEWIEELRTKLDSLSKEDFKKVFDKYSRPVSEDFEKIVEEIAEPTILNAYGTKELARRLRNTICGTSVSEELEEACEQLAENARKHKAETSSPFFSQTDYKQGVIDGAKWQKEHLWKPADGDDLKDET